jgi:hypothetical protein
MRKILVITGVMEIKHVEQRRDHDLFRRKDGSRRLQLDFGKIIHVVKDMFVAFFLGSPDIGFSGNGFQEWRQIRFFKLQNSHCVVPSVFML